MIGVALEVARVTASQLLGRRRTLLLGLLALLPILLALAYRLGGAAVGSVSADRPFLEGLYDALLVTLLLPLVALLVGTAAFGAEVEDGTIIYLLAKPIPRLAIVAGKLVVAIGATVVLAAGSTLLAGLIALVGIPGGDGPMVGYTVAVGAGSFLYAAVFVALGVVTGRALIAGLLYTLIWEGVLAGLLPGTGILSIRQYVLSYADAAGVGGQVTSGTVELSSAIVLGIVVLAAAVAVAAWRLSVFEVPQED